ncbi:hypothetical protein [Mucilaginibacter sp.]|uniref:hypothetical protein n=1 Tax=Mucilaginibacter sp. TaxID=1882438 RepID=UPI00326422A0
MTKDILSPALIAAITSLLISLTTLYQFFKNKRFQEDQFNKANNRTFTSKLYDLRLIHYPKAFEIMDDVYKEKGGYISSIVAKIASESLIEWKKGVINLIISNEAHTSFYTLRDALMKNPAHQNHYTPEQIDKIVLAVKDFRKQLRRDLGFMFREEKERRNSLRSTPPHNN